MTLLELYRKDCNCESLSDEECKEYLDKLTEFNEFVKEINLLAYRFNSTILRISHYIETRKLNHQCPVELKFGQSMQELN